MTLFAFLQTAGRGLFFLLCCIVLPLCVAIFAVTIWAAFAADAVIAPPASTLSPQRRLCCVLTPVSDHVD